MIDNLPLDFYLKHGYSIFGKIPSLPNGNARIFMQKNYEQW